MVGSGFSVADATGSGLNAPSHNSLELGGSIRRDLVANIPEHSSADLAELIRCELGRGLGAIWAQAAGVAASWRETPGGGAIGRGGQMPWHVPADLRWFSKLTKNTAVIMGRRTWESLPAAYRPLPERDNYVLTGREQADFPGAITVKSLATALRLSADVPTWIIGGGKLYKDVLERCDIAALTQLRLEIDGADTYAPELDGSWSQLAFAQAANDAACVFTLWRRK
ncbi:dihydrofolate reductase [Canibacter sp. lx-45]|uniref:dihydrofolate reductase n=1 Tax=Canibacter zhuwentaonis TaxID=2837491 RepID=UPI001BDD6C69|nr:dihydrofolate reductase [Canibacter zhuwentaonis]MBT1035104.1 dihydrofolate reductase [Canibacter zhuwentaonis]